jgi:exopolysaccharide biosynthesis polyprenyl glycosylphosphotransferase
VTRPPRIDVSGYARRALTADLVMLALAAFLTMFVSPTDSPTGEVPIQPLGWAIGFPLIVTSLFYLRGMYKPPLRPDLFEMLRLVVTGLAVASIAVITVRVVLANDAYVSAETVRQLLVAVPLVLAGRWSLLWVETRARRSGESSTRTLVVGHGKVGSLTAKRLLAEPEVGLRPIGFLDDAPLDGFRDLPPVLGGLSELEAVVAEHSVKHVIIAFTNSRDEELLTIARRAWAMGLSVSIVPRLFEIQQGQRVTLEHLGGLPLLQVSQADPDGWQFRVKYALDRIVAAIALVALAPLLIAAAAAVKLSLGGSVLYRQPRVGRDGHVFDMLKLRTLAHTTVDSEADADWAAEQLGGREIAALAPMDGRSTPVCRMLRRLSIDELPQIWNVLRGDMSLVGPRPERASYVEAFEGGVYRYGERHRVKSGLTGWAQIHGLRGRTPLAERVEWDNHYIENWSLWLDLKIAIRTIPCLFRGQGL